MPARWLTFIWRRYRYTATFITIGVAGLVLVFIPATRKVGEGLLLAFAYCVVRLLTMAVSFLRRR